ncbi:FAD-binding oxidoreductase [Rhodococcus opacus]
MTATLAVPSLIVDRVIRPGDRRYPQLRSTYTSVATPAFIVLARDSADVAAALEFANTNRLAVSVRSGGHGLSGRSSNNGGVVIDLSEMHRVDVVDPDTRLVRVEAGARWADVAATLGPKNLAISSGDHGNVGVGGLATGGGIGWLARTYGLTIDHVRAVDVVLPDGTAVHADANQHAEVFWAVRGAGSGVGIILAFEIEAMTLGDVGVARFVYDVDPDGRLLHDWSTALADAPRALTTAGFLTSHQPTASLVLTAVVASSDPETVQTALAPLHTGKLRPVHAEAHIAPYTNLISTADLHGNSGQMPAVTSSAMFTDLTPDGARALMDVVLDRRRGIVQLRSLGGAVNDIAEGANAYAHRSHQVLATGTLFQRGRQSELAELWRPVVDHASGAYVNFESGIDPAVFHRAYPGATGDRVLKAWRDYDPDAVLRPIRV